LRYSWYYSKQYIACFTIKRHPVIGNVSSKRSAGLLSEPPATKRALVELGEVACPRAQPLAQLEAALVVQHSQQMALQRAAERAAEASHALLAERRACAALRAETAELRAVMAGRLVVEEGGGGGGGEHLLDGRLVRVGS
jgi:hypothetical protein